MRSGDTTIVTACNRKFIWGAYLLVSSLRMHGVHQTVNIVAREFDADDTRLLEQFSDVCVLKSHARICHVQADKPQALFSARDTEYITWLDSDCIVNGNISELLVPPDSGTFMIRFREQDENKLRFRSTDATGGIPRQVREQWQSDMGSTGECQILTTCVTNAFTVHGEHLLFIAEWDRLNTRISEQYAGAFPLAYCHSSGSGLSDELVLNALFAYSERAPVTSEYMLNKRPQAQLLHLSLIPKPWERWTRETLLYYQNILDILDYCRQQGFRLPSPLPPQFDRRKMALTHLDAYTYSFTRDVARRFRHSLRRLLT